MPVKIVFMVHAEAYPTTKAAGINPEMAEVLEIHLARPWKCATAMKRGQKAVPRPRRGGKPPFEVSNRRWKAWRAAEKEVLGLKMAFLAGFPPKKSRTRGGNRESE